MLSHASLHLMTTSLLAACLRAGPSRLQARAIHSTAATCRESAKELNDLLAGLGVKTTREPKRQQPSAPRKSDDRSQNRNPRRPGGAGSQNQPNRGRPNYGNESSAAAGPSRRPGGGGSTSTQQGRDRHLAEQRSHRQKNNDVLLRSRAWNPSQGGSDKSRGATKATAIGTQDVEPLIIEGTEVDEEASGRKRVGSDRRDTRRSLPPKHGGADRGHDSRSKKPRPQNDSGSKRDDTLREAHQIVRKKPKAKTIMEAKVDREVFIPASVRVGDLARIVDVKLFSLVNRMRRLGFSEEQFNSDYLLNSEDAGLIAMEYGLTPVVDEEKSFDIYPEPTPSDTSNLPLRPPVVTIMGHVDHGKTTLLDALRKTSVAAGEAGGITQHIGAFSVPVSSLVKNYDAANASGAATITFLDTPGHAAFTAMRARGAHVTDIIVLVVAADDGVMPQTKEVINLSKSESSHVGLVVAINKVDKPGVDLNKVKSALGAEDIFLEEDGGDVPSVHVSGLKRIGLDDLVETLSTVAEVRDLRADTQGKAEGFVLESRVEKGRGNVATVLVTRGTLKTGQAIVAGTTWCKVRQMTDDKGAVVKAAPPGSPVTVIGWRDLPKAGDELLQAVNGEDEAKRAITNRLRDVERKALMQDVEKINEKRRLERERIEQEAAEAEALEKAGADHQQAIQTAHRDYEAAHRPPDFKELRLIIRADVSGTVEAVVGALEGIGNKEAGVKIIHTGVGDVTDSDVAMAEAAEGIIIGFSVKAPRSVEGQAASAKVPLVLESVIYRLIETVRARVAGLLPPIIESRVLGEATVQQVFSIALKGKATLNVAGCRITNGAISKTDKVRVLRGEARETVFEGVFETMKQAKKDITEARKGNECGLSLEGFQDIRAGDSIVAYSVVEKPAIL